MVLPVRNIKTGKKGHKNAKCPTKLQNEAEWMVVAAAMVQLKQFIAFSASHQGWSRMDALRPIKKPAWRSVRNAVATVTPHHTESTSFTCTLEGVHMVIENDLRIYRWSRVSLSLGSLSFCGTCCVLLFRVNVTLLVRKR